MRCRTSYVMRTRIRSARVATPRQRGQLRPRRGLAASPTMRCCCRSSGAPLAVRSSAGLALARKRGLRTVRMRPMRQRIEHRQMGIGLFFACRRRLVPRAGRRASGAPDRDAARAHAGHGGRSVRKEYPRGARLDRLRVYELKPTELSVSVAGWATVDVQARCLLVRVEDKWLLPRWRPALKGTTWWAGCCPPIRPSSQSLIERSGKRDPNTALLPYEVQCRRRQRQRPARPLHAPAGWRFRSRGSGAGPVSAVQRPAAAQSDPTPAAPAWAYHSLPNP